MGKVFTISNARSFNPLAILLRFLLISVLSVAILTGEAILVMYVYFASDLPEILPFEDIRFGGVNTVVSSEGQPLAEMFKERRYIVPKEEIPDIVIRAFLASEDERFFEHRGLDFLGIVRAVMSNIRYGEIREGASTITQQLARNLLLSRERTLSRKIREAILARRLEDIYTKDQILLLYLNLIYLGEGYYGVQAASLGYFGKRLKDLTIAEAATIAALSQSPSKTNPLVNPEETGKKRARVLRRMREAGFISEEQMDKALAEQVRAKGKRDVLGDGAPWAAVKAMEKLKETTEDSDFSRPLLGGAGFTVETTIDMGLQMAAQEVLWEGVLDLSKKQGFVGAIATLKPEQVPQFLIRNSEYLKEQGDAFSREGLLLAVVEEVLQDKVKVSVTEEIKGTIPLSEMRWAGRYTEFPKDEKTGRFLEGKQVSFDARIKDCRDALKPLDVVLVQQVSEAKMSQTDAHDPFERRVFRLAQLPKAQGALLVTDFRSGYVLALVGSPDFDISQFDHTQALRQSGSAIKPVYYSKAYDLAIPPSSVVSGAPFRASSWVFEEEEETPDMTIFEALARSENLVSLRVFKTVLERAGLQALNEWGIRLGLSHLFQGYPAEALGLDVSATELLQVFATFANMGIRKDFVLIKAIREGNGGFIVDNRSPLDPAVSPFDALFLQVGDVSDTTKRAISKDVSYIIGKNLRYVVEAGTAKQAKRLRRPVCGKTGTLPYDVWFIGYTDQMAGIVWVGEGKRERFLGKSKKDSKVFGANTALPIFLKLMERTPSKLPVKDPLGETPEDVVEIKVDPLTGKRSDNGVPMPHLKGTEPSEQEVFAEEETAEF
jgi:penicillin-binding protein 1A